ncbi:anaphase promoting complex subunit Apc11, putative [Talaromyces stipitatus ATCC 10500]|uniref:Anaphase-promoting complex subunit 11 n=1 Tax=Talaromyces stipitatus (strain ATCC 10500 / CBS 375.48 / QM 6759 / NRRL 1006) TaxID=441959 RepID=B8M4B0_TALSN|nr:anaphase promoting complex subunit Apc11, putative [Talaromyces stipitatus ATCC 10500]EED19105.1 anaphase promoting complex subunit Apc11, putative [Talaromyces stipitatus ATCC 10500]
MKVTIKEWNAVATWRWDMPEDEVCGICRVQFDGTCPTCKFPGDDCSLLIGKCGHSFHMHCLITWIQQESSKGLCPMCRQTYLYFLLEMSSLPKQHNITQSSSSARQSPFRATNTTGAIPPTTTSRPRPIGHLPENKQKDASYNQLGDNISQSEHEGKTAPEVPFKGPKENRPKPAPNFKPFFTLIEDANSSDYHHPTVHYIFSDDDAELMTEASLRVLETGSHATSPLPLHTNDNEDALGSGANQQHSSDIDRPSLLPPPIPGVKERFIVLDVEQSSNTAIGNPSSAPDALVGTSAGTGTTVVSSSSAPKQTETTSNPFGYRIVSAHSLTPDWQVLDASLSPAPTFDTPQQTTSDQAGVSNTLMLRIQGTSGYSRDIPVGKDRQEQTLEEMMEQFDKRMSELRRVIETSGDYSPLVVTTTAQQGYEEKGADEQGKETREETGEGAATNESRQGL